MSDQILSIFETGTSDHPRFLITDPLRRIWTGEYWADDIADGRLYLSVNDAALAIQQIMRAQHGDKPLRRYVAPVVVDVYSDNELSLDEIAKWLSKVSQLIIDSDKNGNGPVEGSLGLTRIEWGELRKDN